MSERIKGGATYQDVLSAPPDRIAEVTRGDLYLSPRPAPRHARVASAIVSDLHDAFDRGRSGPGGWWILFEPELHLNGNILVPDIAGWRRTRMPELPEGSWFSLAPDWICEVASPRTEKFDRNCKMPLYAAYEVEYLWLVDPDLQHVEVLRRDASHWKLVTRVSGSQTLCAEPFEIVPVELARLWA
jgi:Uma2 family endonuclease